MGGTDRIVDGVEINSILAEKMDEKGGDATGRRSVESEELRRKNYVESPILKTFRPAPSAPPRLPDKGERRRGTVGASDQVDTVSC